MGLVEEIRPDVLDLKFEERMQKMKKCLICAICGVCVVALIAAGCASNANQKISSPLLGTVKNEYTIYNIHLDNIDNFNKTTNIIRHAVFSAAVSTNSQENTKKTVMASLGRGNELFAIDNQVLVGRDIGNATSNAVNASASIPLNF